MSERLRPVPVVVARPHRRRAFLALAVTALVAAGCDGDPITGKPLNTAPFSAGPGTSGTTARPTTPTGTVTWGESTEFPANLMPLIAAGNSTAVGNLTVRVLDGLYRSSPEVTYTPDPDQGTATSAVVNGQQVVDIKINPKAVWADGRPITAADYVFTVNAQKSVAPAAGGCPALLSTIGFDQVEKAVEVGDKEVKILFQQGKSFADWRGLFSGSSALLLSKHVVDQGSPSRTCAYLTKGWPAGGGIPLGAQNGPWLLEGSNVDTANKTVTLVPNPRYWGAQTRLARLVYRTIGATSDVNVTALRSQVIDIAYPLPQLDLVAQLKQVTGIKTTISFGASFEHLEFNTKDPLLKFPQIRKAIALALDRPALVDSTIGEFSDRAQPLGNHLVLNTQQGYTDNGGEYSRPDIAKAKQLIQSVGGKLGSDGIFRVQGRPLSFRVMTTVGNPLRDRTIQIMARQVKAAGIKLTEFANPDIFADRTHSSSLEAEGFQIAMFAWLGSPALSTNNSIYLSPTRGGGQNYSQGADPTVDRYLQQLTTAATPDDELRAADAADRQLWMNMFTLPLYQKPTVLAFRDNIDGLEDNGTLAGPLWNSDQISVR